MGLLSHNCNTYIKIISRQEVYVTTYREYYVRIPEDIQKCKITLTDSKIKHLNKGLPGYPGNL